MLHYNRLEKKKNIKSTIEFSIAGILKFEAKVFVVDITPAK
jgi:hypothetical protein